MNETNEGAVPSKGGSNNEGINAFLMPGSVLLAGVFIAGAMVWNNQYPAPLGAVRPQTAGVQGGVVDVKDVVVTDSPFIGNPNAKITIAYWSDYQCPFCKKFDQESLTQIEREYVATGKVKVVFKDFQFLGPDSQTAALYGRAVWDLYPSQYRDWHEAMFEAQDEEHGGFGDEPTVQALTKTIAGIDVAKVIAATKTNKAAYEAAIAADRDEAQKFGISATPSLVIGTQMLAGAQPYASFKAAIEAALK